MKHFTAIKQVLLLPYCPESETKTQRGRGTGNHTARETVAGVGSATGYALLSQGGGTLQSSPPTPRKGTGALSSALKLQSFCESQFSHL